MAVKGFIKVMSIHDVTGNENRNENEKRGPNMSMMNQTVSNFVHRYVRVCCMAFFRVAS